MATQRDALLAVLSQCPLTMDELRDAVTEITGRQASVTSLRSAISRLRINEEITVRTEIVDGVTFYTLD